MKKLSFSTLLFLSLAVSNIAQHTDKISLFAANSVTQAGFSAAETSRSHRIKDLVVLDEHSGLIYTSDALFRTDDGGSNWREFSIPGTAGRVIASVFFENKLTGLVLIAETASATVEMARTADGGQSWTRHATTLENAAFYEAVLDDASLTRNADGSLQIVARIPTSSNFTGRVIYRSDDGGNSWRLASRSIDPREESEASARREKDGWAIETSGECAAFKTGCIQETKLFIRGMNATPPQLKERLGVEREKAKSELSKPRMFALPPGGSTRISLNRGFDKCQAGSVAQMQIWWNNSFHFDSNIYFSGRARACPNQPFTGNPAWIDQVSAMGWGLIPTVVGYQAPCSVSSTPHKFSYDIAIAEQQGRGEADIAATDAANIGLTAGSVIYYDMERYDAPTPDTLGCRPAAVAFLKGWTERIRELGYISGTYGSPKNVIEDWQFMPPASRMDAIWMARWDNVPSVWTYISFPAFPNNLWNNHQRIKQWQAPHFETWGGVTFEVDGNISDGPVAGIPVPRNKVADFDGDGKTDISVFRPATGQWFVAGTLGPSYNVHQFGTAEDIPAPGDYDGDGKTDLMVFRPSNSTWYLRAKGVFIVRPYGEGGDVPAAADYDGDGRTDIAVFRPSTGTWYIAYSDSLNSFLQVPFGQDGDRPAAADYDGDGKADIAVWRAANATWYVQASTGGFFPTQFGVSTDVPAQGDYDGDGKADRAVFRPDTGTWYLLLTASGMYVQQFGVDGDQPVTGDYDGDGRYDISVFRPSNGTWYMSQSQGGYVVRQFGVQNDKPIPRAYLPQ